MLVSVAAAQAEAARAAAEEMVCAAEAIAQQVEAEQRILRLHASLGAAEEAAKAALRVRLPQPPMHWRLPLSTCIPRHCAHRDPVCHFLSFLL